MEERLEHKLKKFCQDLKEVYSESLRSVVIYGSVVSGEHLPRHSNVNLLVVLDKVDFEALKLAYKIFQKYKKTTRAMPLVFDRGYIKSSLDVFPIEFLDMKENYIVIYGEDPLKDLQIDKKNLRFQCEQELKGKLIRLRQAYLEATFTRDLKDVLIGSLASFIAIFRNLIRLKGAHPAQKSEELITQMSRLYNLDEGIAQNLLRVKSGKEKISHKGIIFLYRDWLDWLTRLSAAVDGLT